MWVIEEMVNYGIDFNSVAIGVIPFGTGNDFSRVIGWGGNIYFNVFIIYFYFFNIKKYK